MGFYKVVVLPQNASKRVKMRRFAKSDEIAKMLEEQALRANRRKAVRSSQAGRREFESHRPLFHNLLAVNILKGRCSTD